MQCIDLSALHTSAKCSTSTKNTHAKPIFYCEPLPIWAQSSYAHAASTVEIKQNYAFPISTQLIFIISTLFPYF